MVKPGSKDRKARILITGLELDELQRFVWMMAESFVLDDPEYYPTQDSPEYLAIKALRDRLHAEEDVLYAELQTMLGRGKHAKAPKSRI
jgi:hypothetical protein